MIQQSTNDGLSIEAVCDALDVSVSGYYAWRERDPSERQQADKQLGQAIVRVFQTSRQTYGSHRVYQALRQDGVRTSRKRVARLMRTHGLRSVRAVKRPGPPNQCSDSELLTMTLVGECRGWQLETHQLLFWHGHRDLFPILPSQSRFNRRRALKAAFQLLRRMILGLLDLALDRDCVIDSLPIAVVNFHHVPEAEAEASREWAMHAASFGKVASKKITIFGYKLHLLVMVAGVIVDFRLAPAHVSDLQA